VFGAAAVVAFTALYAHFYVDTIRITNLSGSELSNVELVVAQESVWTGRLGARDSHWSFTMPRKDGTVGVIFESNGRAVHREFGYVTPGLGQSHRILILSPSQVEYQVH
jgi:hypothetical protein